MSRHELYAAKTWLDAGLNFFYPPVCQLCGSQRASTVEGWVCSPCWSREGGVRFINPPFCDRCGLPYDGDITTTFECANCREMELHFRHARSAVVAAGVVLEVIHRYKYQRALWFEPFLAELLERRAVPELRPQEWDMIIPVPLHPLKKREREFNQAERLGRCLARSTGIPLNVGILKRVEPTRTQTLLTRQERAANVRHAFAIQPHVNVTGKRVVIFDDVLTTGATTSACARVLRDAGAADICVWTVARGI